MRNPQQWEWLGLVIPSSFTGPLGRSNLLRGFRIIFFLFGIPPHPNERAHTTSAHRQHSEMETEIAADRERARHRAGAEGASDERQSTRDTTVATEPGMRYSTIEAGAQHQCKEEAGDMESAGVCVSPRAKATTRYAVTLELVTCTYLVRTSFGPWIRYSHIKHVGSVGFVRLFFTAIHVARIVEFSDGQSSYIPGVYHRGRNHINQAHCSRVT